MDAVKLLDNLTQQGVQILVENDKLSVHSPKGVVTPEIRAELAVFKTEILTLLRETTCTSDQAAPLENGLSLQTIGRLLGGFGGKPSITYRLPIINPKAMAQKLTIAFRPLPQRYQNIAVLEFREALDNQLRIYGAKVESWEKATTEFRYSIKLPLINQKISLKKRVVKSSVNAVIDVERPASIRRKAENFAAEKLYQFYTRFVWRRGSLSIARIATLIGWAEEHAAKYMEDPTNTQIITLTGLDQEFINPHLPYRQKIEIGLNTLTRTFSEIVVGVSSDKISILNMNLSDSIFAKEEIGEFVLKSLIPKIFVPIAPLLLDRFELGNYDPHASNHAAQLVKLGQELAPTGLFPSGFKLSEVLKRQSHRDIVDVIVNGRTGVSYGFIAYAEAPQYIGEVQITEADWEALSPIEGFNPAEIRQNTIGRRYIKTKVGTEILFKQIPDIWVVSSRSGSNKTDLNLERDLLRIGLTDKLILQLPQGIDPGTTDIKPSYDIYVMLAIALSASLYAPHLIQNGAPFVHFHGYPSRQWFRADEYYVGVSNPSVPCGTYESGVFNFLGIGSLVNQYGNTIRLASLIEPDHGTNIISTDLNYLVERLKDGCDRGEIELGGKHFASLKET